MQTLARILAWLKTDPFAAWKMPAIPDAGGIAFLVGFPRSGTTARGGRLRVIAGMEGSR